MEVPRLRLLADEVHVWLAFPNQITNDELLREYRRLLTPEEHEATERFVFARHRHQHLITRALQRDLLSRYTGECPTVWRFEKNAYGKPAISFPGCWDRLKFNLSHTDGLVACAVTQDRDVGVDVEFISRPTSVLELAPSVFSPPELAALRDLAPGRQRARFFALWTLKEAYIKARGMGLSIPLAKFSFAFSRTGEIAIDIDPSLNDDAVTWHFERSYATADHAIALAARRPNEQPVHVSYFETVPLRAELRTPLDLTQDRQSAMVPVVRWK
jgi:4'-phosphopantetheinyl transferase